MAFEECLRYTPVMSFPSVTIYTTKTCGYCKASKDLLEKHHVPYKEIDVGANSEHAREMIKISGQMGVPFILIGEGSSQERIIGFDEEAIIHALHL